MCLILLAINQHPDYPLILAANRDEFYARPSKPLSWWSDGSQILAGRDLKSGGSWFGMTRAGNLAAVTNYREGGTKQAQRPSRGILVSDYLHQKNLDWPNWLAANAHRFNGFNLLYGKWDQLNWFSNRSDRHLPLQAGFYGLCNSLLDTPWPKVERGKTLLQQTLDQAHFRVEELLNILRDDQPAADSKLPATGIGQEWERQLSPIFIRSATYGTRASTVLLVNRQEQASLVERIWQQDGTYADGKIDFDLEA